MPSTPEPVAPPPADVADVADDVVGVAERLVAAFAAGDLETYFSCFAPDATFIFHSTDRVLTSTAEYRDLWSEWEADGGFRVQECTTTDQRWQRWPGSAVLVHRVATLTLAGGASQRSDERETIVFARRDGRWLAVHEHLSLHPVGAVEGSP